MRRSASGLSMGRSASGLSMRYYPIFLDLKGRRVAVIGGGRVAERKAAALLRAGAEIQVVSPTLTPRLDAWARGRRIKALRRAYRRGDLKGAALAFAAADDDAVNRAVAREGGRKGIWVNVADRSAPSHFIVPALWAKGDLVLAVSTGGKSPLVAGRLRDDLGRFLSAERALQAKRLARVKERLIRCKVAPKLRREILRCLADGGVSRKALDRAMTRSGLPESEQRAMLRLIGGSGK